MAREKLTIDQDYYFKSQLIPVLARLLDPIEGTDEQMIAERFGLDPKDFKSKAAQRLKQERDAENAAIAMQKDEDRLANCDTLMVDEHELDIFFDPPFETIQDAAQNCDKVMAQLR